jgi:hypothetical protein
MIGVHLDDSSTASEYSRLRCCGAVVDAGAGLLALNQGAQLIVFEPSGKEFKQLAAGNRAG